MSKQVAIAGGSDVAQEVIDAILSRGVYQIIILSRSEAPTSKIDRNNVVWKKVDYADPDSLVAALRGIDTLLSFVALADTNAAVEVQKKLVHAAIKAGVRRFAPSEWSARSDSGITHYAFKDETGKYLEELNRERPIEYTLFQPGLFTNYFAAPHRTAKHLQVFKQMIDFEHRRAIILEGSEDAPITLTLVENFAHAVALALEFPGKWPMSGGMQGEQTTVGKFLELGERIRGPFRIERMRLEDVAKGELKSSWYPVLEHASVPDQYREMVSKSVTNEYLKSIALGGWSVGDDWNRLMPEVRFKSAEPYLGDVWKGKS